MLLVLRTAEGDEELRWAGSSSGFSDPGISPPKEQIWLFLVGDSPHWCGEQSLGVWRHKH